MAGYQQTPIAITSNEIRCLIMFVPSQYSWQVSQFSWHST